MLRRFLGVFAAAIILTACYQTSDHADMRAATTLVVRENGHGSGVVIGERLVLTAAHVVSEPGPISVRFSNGERIDARVIWTGSAETLDVAMLELSRSAPVEPAELSCRELIVDEYVTAYGKPGQGPVLSSVLRVASDDGWLGDSINVTVVQGPINPGMSGGPVFDDDGKVVGFVHSQYRMHVNAGMFMKMWVPNGMGGIVPSSALCAVLPRVSA
jgi:S1-C subfamily serine protease